MLASTLLSHVLVMGGPIAALPPAEKMQVSATVSAGSGMSITGSGGTTFARRSPAFLHVDVGLIHPQLAWLEFAPTAMLELEGRVSFGVMPKLRAFVPFRGRNGKPSRILAFGSLGVPVFVVPFTLVGVQAGVGLGVQVHERFAIVVEGTGAGYFLGSDLMEDAALGKLDAQAGLRVRF
jgi:hypothetical protein